MAQIITVQAGVTYDFSFQYAVDGVRGAVDTIEMSVSTYPQRVALFSQFTFTGNTNGWATFQTNTWTPAVSGDVMLSLSWYVPEFALFMLPCTDTGKHEPGATIQTMPL
jgi:hypothetical protein